MSSSLRPREMLRLRLAEQLAREVGQVLTRGDRTGFGMEKSSAENYLLLL